MQGCMARPSMPEPIRSMRRAVEPLEHQGQIGGYRLSTGAELRADFVIGADGATSTVADAAGLVDGKRVLWGFAIRTYLPEVVDRPAIVFWEPTPRRAFPGYGWVFPGATEGVNVGIGLGTLADRKAGAKAQRALPRFLAHVHRLGLLSGSPASAPARRLGGWLKMGMVGTTPARGNVLLVGDAAGLINPLQGEGISQAVASGRSAAEAILTDPGARRAISSCLGGGPSAVPPDHGRRASVDGRPTPGDRRRVTAPHDGGSSRRTGRGLVGLLERIA